jgi:group I intron endonuclease
MEICEARKQKVVSAEALELVARIQAKARRFVAARSPRPFAISQHSPISRSKSKGVEVSRGADRDPLVYKLTNMVNGKAKRKYQKRDHTKDPLVYKLTNMINGKGYVGKARHSSDRMREHRTYGAQKMRSGKKTQAVDQAIHKYGWENFKVEWLETNIEDEKLLEREAFHMRKHDTMAPKGYNILKPGVEVVSMHDPEVRARWELRNPEGTKKAVATLTAKREAKLGEMDDEDATKLGRRLEMGRAREKKRHAGEEMPPDTRYTAETNAKRSKVWADKRAAKVALMSPEEGAKYMRNYEVKKASALRNKEKIKKRAQSEGYKKWHKEHRKKNAHKVLRLG